MRTRNGSLPVFTVASSPAIIVSFVVESERADAMDLRHAAEIEVERVGRLPFAHHLSSVEIELDADDAVTFDGGLDVLHAAEKLVAERLDVDRRRVRFEFVLDR